MRHNILCNAEMMENIIQITLKLFELFPTQKITGKNGKENSIEKNKVRGVTNGYFIDRPHTNPIASDIL